MNNGIANIAKAALAFLVIAVILFGSGDIESTPVAAQGGGGNRTFDVPRTVPFVFRGDVRGLPHVPVKPRNEFELKEPQSTKVQPSGPVISGPSLALAPMPNTTNNFAGMSRNDTCSGGPCGDGIPPDPNGDVGRNYYIQAVNSSFAVYSKTGTLLASFTEGALWAGSNAPQCDGNGEGDPVVLYDPMADRWILTNLAFALVSGNPVSPYYQCIAVSRTSDPVSGGWYLYAVRTDTGLSGQPPVGTLNDYPKFGIWTNCLYYSANGFNSQGNYVGGEYGSFSRSDMYAGAALTGSIGFAASTSDFFTMIPSNLSAPGSNGLPPNGTPDYYVQESLTDFTFRVRSFTPGPNCGGGGTLSAATGVSQASYSDPGANTIPQPPPATSTNKLDSLGDRIMQKVQYRRVGNTESLWVTHTFRSSSSGPTGSQWAQINVTGGTISTTPVQQQLYNPADGKYRWTSSIAADKDGNVALGYSTSNGTSPNFPSIAYAGRLVGDPLGTMPQTETQLVAGAGSEVNNCGGAVCHRWGDYSSMSVDPVDGCTFWYTNEYYVSQTGGSNGTWNTRIGSFAFPACVPFGSATNTPTSTPTRTPTPTSTPTRTPTPTATTTGANPNIQVSIAGTPVGSYAVSTGNSTIQSYSGENAGPVVIDSINSTTAIIASERVAYSPDGGATWTSFSELMGLPSNQLTTSYMMPWYNNVDLNSQLRFGNVGNSSTTVTVKVAGVVQGSYLLGPNQSTRVSYAGLNNGPVQIASSGGVPIIASERVAYSPDGGATWTSFAEMMGLPAGQLSTSYVMPWYNNVELNTQLRFSDVGNSNTTVTVTVGGVVQGSYSLGPNQSTRVSYPGLNNGPVIVQSSGGVPIIASERVAYFNGSAWTSFSELMGLPAIQLTTSYVMPWYNNVDLNSQLRFGNIGSSRTTVTVKVAGVVKGTYPLAPNQSTRVSYPGLNNGPVIVQSSGGVPIIASERVAYLNGKAWTSFSELMGLPQGSLGAAYWLPVYDNVTYNTQLRFGNVGNANTTVTVTVGGVVTGTYPLAPNQSTRISYAGLNGGPVRIASSGGVPIIASDRVAYSPDGGKTWTSFAEMMGLPAGQLSTSYVMPWYNNVDLNTQLRLAVP